MLRRELKASIMQPTGGRREVDSERSVVLSEEDEWVEQRRHFCVRRGSIH
jgi:hypothetical protein